jgi:hypothetical protein
MNLFWTFGRTPQTGDRADARLLPTQDNKTQKNAGTHIHASSSNSNPRAQCSSGQRQYVPLDRAATGTGNYYHHHHHFCSYILRHTLQSSGCDIPSRSFPTASSNGTPSLSAVATSVLVLVGGEPPESPAVGFLYIAERGHCTSKRRTSSNTL